MLTELASKSKAQIEVISVADPDPVPIGPLDPGSGMGKKSGSGIRIRDDQPGLYCISYSLETIFWVKILKFFYADPRSGIRDGKKSDPG